MNRLDFKLDLYFNRTESTTSSKSVSILSTKDSKIHFRFDTESLLERIYILNKYGYDSAHEELALEELDNV